MQKEVKIPEGVEVDLRGFEVKVKGKLGEMKRNFKSPIFSKSVKIESGDGKIIVSTDDPRRRVKSEVGCIAAHIANMMKGVTKAWEYKLKIAFVHFPMTVKVVGNEVHITNFLGEKFARKAKILDGVKVEIKGEEIIITSPDLEKAGQTAANIEQATRISARDRRVFQDGCFLTERPS
ncbi:MAG: 50S ribosomal protein L6 [Candidatus Aenigmatarchaeota archaeon]